MQMVHELMKHKKLSSVLTGQYMSGRACPQFTNHSKRDLLAMFLMFRTFCRYHVYL